VLTTIASFREAYAAHIARARLEAEGIPAFVIDEHLVGVQPLYADALGGVKLRVPVDCAERARRIVSEDRSGDLRGVVQPRPARRSTRRCPDCGSRAVAQTVVSRVPRAASRGPRFAALVFVTERTCEECGASW
jgi:hypothetical protein